MVTPPLIALEQVRKVYGGGDKPLVEVLHGISLAIQAGEFIAFVGASGSGKSTLMNLLGCLDRPSSGTYRFEGIDVSEFSADELAWLRREAFGFVFQGYHLIATETARENVEIPAIYAGMPEEQRQQRAQALLQRLGLGERLDNRPSQLSGGQQQRVSIARALMNGGRIILADEPTGALDSQSGAEVMALLDELAEAGHTVILITHDREVAARARRVVEIRDGRIISDRQNRPASEASTDQGTLLADSQDRSASLWEELLDACRAAWRVMGSNRFRTGLTLLGIVIGVASVIVMLAIGLGTKQHVIQQMSAMGATIMYVSGKQPEDGGPQGQITLDDLDAIRQLPEISEVMPVIGDPAMLRYGNQFKNVYTFASTANMPVIHRWPVAAGRFHNDDDNLERAPVVVIGYKIKEQFFLDEPALGKRLLLNSAPFEIIGVMAEKGSESRNESYDDMLFIPYQSGISRVFPVLNQPDYTVIDARSSSVVLKAEEQIKELLLKRHGREDFSVGNAGARLQAEAATQNSMTLMLSLIAAVSLVVGGIGVMNVMLMTVRERTREIGIRMAVGARQRDIQRQFMTEAVLLTLIGGLIGVLLGLVIGIALLFWNVEVVFSARAILAAFLCSLATGLVFGFMPARKASQLDPVVALGAE